MPQAVEAYLEKKDVPGNRRNQNGHHRTVQKRFREDRPQRANLKHLRKRAKPARAEKEQIRPEQCLKEKENQQRRKPSLRPDRLQDRAALLSY